MASQGLIWEMSFTTKIVYHILAATDILISILKYKVTQPIAVYKHQYSVEYMTHLTVEMYPYFIFYVVLLIKLKRLMIIVIDFHILIVDVSSYLNFPYKSLHYCSVFLIDK